MRGTKTIINKLLNLLSLCGAVAVLGAASPDYFPLQSGNSWVYRVTQGRNSSPVAINIGDAITVDGRQYYQLQMGERSFLVRQNDEGSVLQYDSTSKAESVWLPLGAPEGQQVQTTFDNCSRTATVASRAARLKTDLGEFNNALQIRYTPNCADAGTTTQYFLPWIGLVHFETTTITGAVVYDLTYARTGLTSIDTKGTSFTVATDSLVYQSGQATTGNARLTLRTSETIRLHFTSGQTYDLRITNDKGETVYFWSANKLFPQVVRDEQIGPGERSWAVDFPVDQLAPGRYLVEAWLTTQVRQYSGAVSFEVR